MDPPPSQGSPFSSVRQQLFHSSHLPPPSQLHLPPVTSSRSNINTLPPLNPSSRMSPYNHRHPSPPSSWPSSLHRTSSSRDDIPSSSPLHSQPVSHPPVLHHSVTRHAEPRQLKREQLAPPQPPPPKDGDDNMPATSDFVKKLYKMLEDQSFLHVVSWGPNGDCFVVKDMNEFTKSILPRMFKHSNFASFVRQLNKYDFHKVKNTDDAQFGEHSWTFRHPDFHADRRDALENIKRKVPAARKAVPSGTGASTLCRSGSAGSPGPIGSAELESIQAQTSTLASHTSALQNQTSALQSQSSTLQSQTSALHAQTTTLQSMTTGMQTTVSGLQNAMSSLQQQVVALQSQNESLRTQLVRAEDRTRGLERCYRDVLGEMVHFQKNLAQQDAFTRAFVQYFLRIEGAKNRDSVPVAPSLPVGSSIPGISKGPKVQTQPQPHTSAIPPPTRAITPSTHPPPSIFAISGNATNTTVGPPSAPLFDSSQPQPSPFLQSLQSSHPHAHPPASASSSTLFRALGHSQPQVQTTLQTQAQTQMQTQTHTQAKSQAQTHLPGMSQSPPQSHPQPPTPILSQTPNQRASSLQAIHSTPRMQHIQFLPAQEAQRALGLGAHPPDPTTIARASLVQMNEMSRRAAEIGDLTLGVTNSSSTAASKSAPGATSSGASEELETGDVPFILPPDMTWDAPTHTSHEGLQVFTLGHLLPRSAIEDAYGNWTLGRDTSPDGGAASNSGSGDDPSTSALGVGGPVNGIGMVREGMQGGFDKEESPGPEEVVRPTPTNPGAGGSPSSASSVAQSSPSMGGQKLRVRRSAFVPGWAVPPRVLLVDDDAVSRRLSSKFLQVFGCAIDVAVDGVGAVNKMNLEKYDLVLMDIVMPKMDGISATSLIRQFDHVTPIISMTSNSRPSEIMTYFSSGMNDILPKPFTKEGLLDMLEKHLMHLKVIQQMSQRVSRSLCGLQLPEDNSLNDALISGPASSTSSSSTIPKYTGDGEQAGPPSGGEGLMDPTTGTNGRVGALVGAEVRINPLAGMGLTDERYQAILKDLVNGDGLMDIGVPEGLTFPNSEEMNMNLGIDVSVGLSVGGVAEKRVLDDDGDSMREGKRGRFEVLD